MRLTTNYIVPLVFGGISGTLLFLTWKVFNATSTEGTIFMICASACLVILGIVLFHYQSMLRRLLKLQTNQHHHSADLFQQFNSLPQNSIPSNAKSSHADATGVDSIEIGSDSANVIHFHKTEDETNNDAPTENKIIINLQAIIEMNQRSVHSYEVLARMETDKGTYKSASEIFENFKQNSEFHYLDKTVLQQTVEVLDCLEEGADLVMQINISKQTLENQAAYKSFYEILNNHLSVRNNLVLEISQQQFTSMSGASRSRLFSIVDLGFKFSIDNCTDYNALSKSLETDRISVVKTPVTKFFEIENKAHEKQIMDLMKKCKAQGVPFIVTHVDEGYQIQQLIKYNVPYAQGFLFSAPKRPKSKV